MTELLIPNGDFDDGLNNWHVVTGNAFAGQPVTAPVPAADVVIRGAPVVPLGGDYWHVDYPLGEHPAPGPGGTAHLLRLVATSPAVLDSSKFTIQLRYLAFRLGGSATPQAALELRVPAKRAKAPFPALDAPDADGFVAVRIAQPGGSDVLAEQTWDLQGLVGAQAKVRLRAGGTAQAPIRLAADYVRMLDAPPPPFHPPLWGFADLHCHPMAQAGFGGSVMAGHMHGPVEDVGSCLQAHGVNHANPLHPLGLALGGGVSNDGSLSVPGWTEGTPAPGDQLAYRGWPLFDDVAHIKTHQDWIRRAYDGGLRLMVALVVHNELLAWLQNAVALPPSFERQTDRDTIEPQVQMLRELVAHNQAWCGIATTPAEARDLIEHGKLAFVLGLETDSIDGLIDDLPAADPAALRAQLRPYFAYLRKLGIVQVNLVHLSDNAFGGMALYDEMFLANTWFRTENPKRLPATEDGYVDAKGNVRPESEQISRPVTLTSWPWSLVRQAAQAAGFLPPQNPANRPFPHGDRNARGMTPAGEAALQVAMGLGMILDIDHMSERCAQRAYEIASSFSPPYPLNSAHSGARVLSPRPLAAGQQAKPGHRLDPEMWPNEGSKSETELEYVRKTGGICGHGTAVGDMRTFDQSLVQKLDPRVTDPSIAFVPTKVVNDCPGTTKSFAQGYEYVTQRLGTAAEPVVPVALGTDLNALLGALGPRFGPRSAHGLAGEVGQAGTAWACATTHERRQDAEAQGNGVLYSTKVRDWRRYRFQDDGLYADYGAVGAPHAKVPGEGHLMWQAVALVEALGATGKTLAEAEAEEELDPYVIDMVLGLQGAPLTAGGQGEMDHCHGALLVRDPSASVPRTQTVLQIAADLGRIEQQWTKGMHGDNTPLVRATAGPQRDFDVNLDGLAHYGMLPDLLQDLANVEMSLEARTALFKSAERYVEVWERCDEVSSQVQP